ncbi:MAG: hypothetical protein JW709_13370, partial [Sedimentisphaerales bacterium]|nr:hypothetical protein [Sedimentisphaerales bacterium]
LIHTDYQRIVELFDRYPQVKLCLSGHLHVLDRVRRGATEYICGGSVCGSWWLGDMYGCDEGYGLVDLFEDGRFDYRYCPFGWQVEPEDVQAVTGERCV